MKLIHFQAPPIFTNTYFYYDADTLDACIIDPSGGIDKIMVMIRENMLKLKYILLTHGHYDHIGGVEELKSLTGAEVLAHKDEAELLIQPKWNMSKVGTGKEISIICDRLLEDGEVIELGKGRLSVIHTPGHTAGGACFYDKEGGILFSGDTLFRGTFGRYDLPTADSNALFASIKEKLLTLPSSVKVLPGHESATTIGQEKKTNPVAGM